MVRHEILARPNFDPLLLDLLLEFFHVMHRGPFPVLLALPRERRCVGGKEALNDLPAGQRIGFDSTDRPLPPALGPTVPVALGSSRDRRG